MKLDNQGKILFVNQGALDFLGYLEEEMMGMNVADILPPEDLDRYHHILDDGVRREFYLPEARMINRELGLSLIEINLVVLGPEEEKEILFVGRDLAHRKRCERERLRRQKHELLSTLSHGFFQEIDATITEALEEIQFVSNNLDSTSTAHRRLAGAIKNCEKGRNLVEIMLDIAEPEISREGVISLTDMILTSASAVSFEGRVDTVLNTDGPLWPVFGDENMLMKAVTHLILNATEALSADNKSEKIIEIGAENKILESGQEQPDPFIPPGEYVRIWVMDHAHGIRDEHLDRIFDPFFSTRKESSQIRGLGLSHVYAIVKRHSGYIDVQSKPDFRTLFSIYLPAFKKEGEMSSPVPTSSVGAGARILLMDDEEVVRNVAGQMLRRLGFQVTFAKEGREAATLYLASYESGHPFDAIILGLNVKEGMGGRTAMKKLLKIDPEVRGIISSGYSSAPEMMDYGRYGFKGAVGKPFHLADLEKTLKVVLGSCPVLDETSFPLKT